MAHIHPAERFFSSGHPVSGFLSIRFEGVDGRALTVSLTAPDAFVDDPATGAVHSSLATYVLDMVMGGAAMGELEKIQPIATAGLTAQHMRRAIAGEALVCTARCDGIHSGMVHMSGMLAARSTGEVLSTATGTFMIGTRAKPIGARL